ncbi:MAG: electron transport complex subunit RsxB [Porticoccaceae bacterium]
MLEILAHHPLLAALVVLATPAALLGAALGAGAKKWRSSADEVITHIDALLPQTQCGQCGHPGCRPYAEAIASGEAINRCPPGGQKTIDALARLLRVPPQTLDPAHGEASDAQLVAYIREDECIGCTKCIQACPVDAILGATRLMHTVIASECTGCDLCVAPCPVDCIDMIATAPAVDVSRWPMPAAPGEQLRNLRSADIHAAPELAQPCIRCGLCAEVCPSNLLPQQLLWYSQARDYDELRALDLFACIECGACASVCPSNIPLVDYYRAAKTEIRHQDAQKQEADHARQRFQARQQRLTRIEADKAAKREARRQATDTAHASTAAVQPTSATSTEALFDAVRARAAARQASPAEQRAKLERSLETARNRVAFAEDKLRQAESGGAEGELASQEQLEKLRVKVKEAQLKEEDAQRRLAQFQDLGESRPERSIEERIRHKITSSPRQQLEDKIQALRERVATSEARIAEESDERTQAALRAGLEKQHRKIADAQQQLAELGPEGDQPVEDPPALNAALAAIARAQARTATTASARVKNTPDIAALEERIANLQEKLTAARDAQAPQAEALQIALTKLEAQLQRARQERDS